MDAKEIISWFGMQRNPDEGGYFAATYTSGEDVKGKRSICSAIYYMIDPTEFSALHRVGSDMLYHFYSGDAVQMLLLYPKGYPIEYEICIFSNDLSAGGSPMKVIPAGTWLGSRLVAGGSYALMGVSMAPGFEPSDYAIGKRKELDKEYPAVQWLIDQLTRG